jgi:hypothetical protein
MASVQFNSNIEYECRPSPRYGRLLGEVRLMEVRLVDEGCVEVGGYCTYVQVGTGPTYNSMPCIMVSGTEMIDGMIDDDR